jgi:hypothetical protein
MRALLRCCIGGRVEPWFGDAGQIAWASSVNAAATREGGRYVEAGGIGKVPECRINGLVMPRRARGRVASRPWEMMNRQARRSRLVIGFDTRMTPESCLFY